MTSPDGARSRVAYVREDVRAGDALIARGKYLVDDTGRPTYLVDPGVCGTYPQRLERVAAGQAPLPVPLDAPIELGADRAPYRRVTLEQETAGLTQGTYLVSEDGTPVWFARETPKFDAPKAQLFRLIIDGTLGGTLPWGLVLVGVFLAIMMELVGVSSLPFAVGLYLPISTSGGVFVGGIVRRLVDRKRNGGVPAAEADFSPGMLMASGLIAGGAITGVIQSVIALRDAETLFDMSGKVGALAHNESWWPMAPFVALAALLYVVGTRKGARVG
jgi:hypothetical protein